MSVRSVANVRPCSSAGTRRIRNDCAQTVMGALNSPTTKNPAPTSTWFGVASSPRNPTAAPACASAIPRASRCRRPANAAPATSPAASADISAPSTAAPPARWFFASHGAVTSSMPSAMLNAMNATVVVTMTRSRRNPARDGRFTAARGAGDSDSRTVAAASANSRNDTLSTASTASGPTTLISRPAAAGPSTNATL
jgi:hypothetical protein